jgi:hypothetical protein
MVPHGLGLPLVGRVHLGREDQVGQLILQAAAGHGQAVPADLPRRVTAAQIQARPEQLSDPTRKAAGCESASPGFPFSTSTFFTVASIPPLIPDCFSPWAPARGRPAAQTAAPRIGPLSLRTGARDVHAGERPGLPTAFRRRELSDRPVRNGPG